MCDLKTREFSGCYTYILYNAENGTGRKILLLRDPAWHNSESALYLGLRIRTSLLTMLEAVLV